MTPAFWGSEPAVATSGKYAGTSILDDEQRRGLDLVRALTPDQRAEAVLETAKTEHNILAQAFSDNLVLEYAGVSVASFSPEQRRLLVDLVGSYVRNMREPHAGVRLADVEAHLEETFFAWIGDTEDDSVYYYRVHSPVILIEFDHETLVGLRIPPPGCSTHPASDPGVPLRAQCAASKKAARSQTGARLRRRGRRTKPPDGPTTRSGRVAGTSRSRRQRRVED